MAHGLRLCEKSSLEPHCVGSFRENQCLWLLMLIQSTTVISNVIWHVHNWGERITYTIEHYLVVFFYSPPSVQLNLFYLFPIAELIALICFYLCLKWSFRGLRLLILVVLKSLVLLNLSCGPQPHLFLRCGVKSALTGAKHRLVDARVHVLV